LASHSEGAAHHPSHAEIAKLYYRTFWWLMILLVATLGAAAVDLKQWNLLIAMVIATWKASLVVANFMHLKFSTPLVKFYGTVAFFWLIIMFVMILMDYVARDHMLPQ
jgi:cytochrome c oxidase subunit 4